MAKSITHAEYVERVKAVQPSWDVITAYLGMNKKVTFHETVTDVTWVAFAKTPLQGVGAPKPGSKRLVVDEQDPAKGRIIDVEVTPGKEIPNDRVIAESVSVPVVEVDLAEVEQRTIAYLQQDETPTPETLFQRMLDDKWGDGAVQFTGARIPEDYKNKVALLHVPTGTKYRTTMNAALKKLPKNVAVA